jgi:hypothetical protein
MDKLLEQFWTDMKGKGKGKGKSKGQPSKKQRTQKMNPCKRLTIASAKLTISNSKSDRQLRADLTHTAFFTNPFPEAFKEAVDTTAATRGTDKRLAAKATWLATCKGLKLSKPAQSVKEAYAILQQHYADPKDLDRHILECRANVTYDQTMMKISWWFRGIDTIDEAFQHVLIAMGGDIRHSPAPPFGLERETSEALTDVLALQSTDSSASSAWM